MAKRLQLVIPDDLKKSLEDVSSDVGISQNHLAILSLYSLLANYEKAGSFIFADLLDPSHRSQDRN